MHQLSIIIAVLICLGYNSFAHPNPYLTSTNDNLTVREALNIAARQQTLTQRIAKVYLALNNNLYEPKFYQERDQAIEEFQKQLDQLKWYTPTEKIKEALDNVREIWQEFKKVAGWSINKKGAAKLLSQCDQILNASRQLVSAYEDYASELGALNKNNDLIGVVKLLKETGTQRMLTQRVMLFYLAAKQDIEKETSLRKLDATTKEYNNVIKNLSSAEINSEKILKEIKEMEKYWLGLDKYLKFFDEDPAYVNSMLLLSDELTKKADLVSLMYQDLGKKLSVSRSINVIAYQNMLTQRIAKSYVAITYNYSAAKYKKELVESIDLFEEQMHSIHSSAPTEDIKEAIRVVEIMWKNYRKIALDWKDLGDIKVGKLLEKSHIIMASCDRVAQAIEEHAQTIPEYKSFYEKNGKEVADQNNIARQVHLAGLQRVYSQRIVVYFMMNAMEKDSYLSQERLKECILAYNKGHKELLASTVNTNHINTALHSIIKEWEKIEDACNENQKDKIVSILEQSDTLFEKWDNLNTLYEKRMDQLITE